jgi:hypothetical protein
MRKFRSDADFGYCRPNGPTIFPIEVFNWGFWGTGDHEV